METDPARTLHERLLEVRRAQRRCEYRLGLLLVEMNDTGHFRTLGYASIVEYAERVLDLPPRATRDMVRVARAVGNLPELVAALEAGEVDWTKAREVVRVAVPGTDSAWTGRARHLTSRELEQEVSGSSFGRLPPSGEPEIVRAPARRRISFEVESADAEVIAAALAMMRARTGLDATELEDGAVLAEMARRILDGGLDEDEPDPTHVGERYKVVLKRCPACQQVAAPDAEVSDTIADESACDAEIIDMRPGPAQGHATRVLPPVLRRKLLDRAGWRCEVTGCRNRLWLDVHHIDVWARHQTHDPRRLVVLCGGHHRATHVGGLAVDRRVDGRVVIRRADGSGEIAVEVSA